MEELRVRGPVYQIVADLVQRARRPGPSEHFFEVAPPVIKHGRRVVLNMLHIHLSKREERLTRQCDQSTELPSDGIHACVRACVRACAPPRHELYFFAVVPPSSIRGLAGRKTKLTFSWMYRLHSRPSAGTSFEPATLRADSPFGQE